MFSFSLGTELIFGENALNFLSSLGAKKVLLVTDDFFSKNGLGRKILSLAGGDGTVFDKVQPDPSARLTAEGGALLAKLRPDLLIALGGGSSMDCAKGILLSAEQRPLFVAIPTTSGTGSEVTSFSILTHENVKYPLVDKTMRPDYAILDESLLAALPSRIIAEAGMDAVTHCVEALSAKGASTPSDALASCALRTLLESLPASYAGQTQVRGELHLAATMAGIAFDNAGLGLCHALCHALGGAFHLAHGRLGAVLLPAVMEFNEPVCGRKFASLAKSLALEGSGESLLFRKLLGQIKKLRKTLQLPQSLQEAGISKEALKEKLEDIVTAAQKDGCLLGNPRPCSREEMKDILLKVVQ